MCGAKRHAVLGGSGVFKRWGLVGLVGGARSLDVHFEDYSCSFLPASVSHPPQGEDSLFPDAPTAMMSQMFGTKNQVTEHSETMNLEKPFLSSVVPSGILVSYVIKT